MILGYHSIQEPVHEPGAGLYCVSVGKFKKQMDFLRNNFTIAKNSSLSLALSSLEKKKNTVVITLDDGDATNYKYALPILEEFGLKAYFFIIAEFVGRDGYMNWPQIKELHDKGHIIGSHGITHKILEGMTEKDLRNEIIESRRILETALKMPIEYFSVPRGFCNDKIIQLAKEAEYKAVFTSNLSDIDGYKLGRIAVKANWDIEYFKRIVERGVPFGECLCQKLRNAAKGVLGAKRYDEIRAKLLKSS
ncbi:MAG: polysaccharide deacetylase family protein [Candidatus Omnitrophica bacterium]|nr:polysaccharide deacetylase family protein [Candidatus Omnitrophota bacterium]